MKRDDLQNAQREQQALLGTKAKGKKNLLVCSFVVKLS
jgi:hypothetical protein